jgi:hypothetical protein
MTKPHFTPTSDDYRAALRFNSLALAVFAFAMLVMIVGLSLATSWVELVMWTAVAAVTVLAVCAIAFIVGSHGGPSHG